MQTFNILRQFNDVDLIKNRFFWMVKLNKSCKGMQSSFRDETMCPSPFLKDTQTHTHAHKNPHKHTYGRRRQYTASLWQQEKLNQPNIIG